MRLAVARRARLASSRSSALWRVGLVSLPLPATSAFTRLQTGNPVAPPLQLGGRKRRDRPIPKRRQYVRLDCGLGCLDGLPVFPIPRSRLPLPRRERSGQGGLGRRQLASRVASLHVFEHVAPSASVKSSAGPIRCNRSWPPAVSIRAAPNAPTPHPPWSACSTAQRRRAASLGNVAPWPALSRAVRLSSLVSFTLRAISRLRVRSCPPRVRYNVTHTCRQA